MSLTITNSVMTLGAVMWHWWIAPLLVIAGVVMMIAIIVGYLKQVSSTRYPPKSKLPSEKDPSQRDD